MGWRRKETRMCDTQQFEEMDSESLAIRKRRIGQTLMEVMARAIDPLGRAAAGERVIRDEIQLRSCIAIARLAAAMMLTAPQQQFAPPRSLAHPSLSEE